MREADLAGILRLPDGGEDLSNLVERSDVVLAFARVLYINGQSTDETLAAAERLGDIFNIRAIIMPRWGELQLEAQERNVRLTSVVAADPSGVTMDRVASTMQAIEDLEAGRLGPAKAMESIRAISEASPSPTWLFTFAAAGGAVALAVLFGVRSFPAAALIFGSAATGAIVRRSLAHYSANSFVQPFCAALIAGVIGALAVRYELSSALRLVAVCPCMVLVPGPAVLNGALDLIQGRIHLGAARLTYAGLVITAISTGLLLGLALLGVSLPADAAARIVPLWQDITAAGVAVASYCVFFSMPLRMLAWPVAVGMLAHAFRWEALNALGSSASIGALIACLVVGLILTPVARHWDMPFAAIGFAAVVSMIPGVFLFRMASGLLQLANGSLISLELINSTITDGMTAARITLAISLGLVIPKIAVDSFTKRRLRTKPES